MPRRKKQDQAAAGFATGATSHRISPVDIQQKEFRLAFRGYNERDVDQFLDEITEEFARLFEENKRFREELGSQGTARLDAGSAADGDAILRQARSEAARIVAEAESKARAIAAGSGTAVTDPSARRLINAFLGREREFLQSLAGLIQGHAESVKADIRRSRQGPVDPGGPGDPGAPGAGRAPSPAAPEPDSKPSDPAPGAGPGSVGSGPAASAARPSGPAEGAPQPGRADAPAVGFRPGMAAPSPSGAPTQPMAPLTRPTPGATGTGGVPGPRAAAGAGAVLAARARGAAMEGEAPAASRPPGHADGSPLPPPTRAALEAEEILDLRDQGGPTSRFETPVSRSSKDHEAGPASDQKDDEGERSLRELFWGGGD